MGDSFSDFLEDNFVTSCLLSSTPSYGKGSGLKGKNLIPNSFLLEWILFQKESKIILTEITPLKVHLLPLILSTLGKNFSRQHFEISAYFF